MTLKILLPNQTVSKIELFDEQKLDSACYNSLTGNFMVGLTNEDGKSEIHIYEHNGKLLSRFDSFRVWDCIWDQINNVLYISNGNTFFALEAGQTKPKRIAKFNHVRYSPIKCSLSPSNKFIGLLKYRGGSDRFHFIDIDKNELIDPKLICSSYSWIDDKTIVYSTISGKIGYYDIVNRKKSTSSHHLKSILKSTHSSIIGIQKSIKKLDKEKQSWIRINDPLKIDEYLYFVINSGNLFGSALIKYCNSEYELVFDSKDKIQNYDLDNNLNARLNMAKAENMIWSYYSLVEENGNFLEREYNYYLSNNNRMNQCMTLLQS